MKKNITRIYDRKKVDSRKKYMLIILLILVLQVAIYFGAFSKAESVIPIKYINYYSLETYDSSIGVKSDLKGKYIILPEWINNRQVINYYIEEVVETTITNTIDDETIKETTETKTYKPNDTYYIGDLETIAIKVEYGEYITTQTSAEASNDSTDTEELDNTIQNLNNVDNLNDNSVVEENIIRDTVYLGNIRSRGRRRNRVKPI